MSFGACAFPETDTQHVRLRPQRRPSTPGLERLEHLPRRRRFGVGASVRLTMSDELGRDHTAKVMLQDISQTGLFVRAAESPKLGQSVMLSFRCGQVSCFAAGTVVDLRWARGFAVELEGASHSFDTLFGELDAVREVVKRHILGRLREVELHIA